jgi:hypothetical protein
MRTLRCGHGRKASSEETADHNGTPTERGGFNFTIVATDVATGATKQGGTYNFTVYPAAT